MEYRRLLAQDKRRKDKELGKCRSCSNLATPGQTRCPTCAEKHREYGRSSNANRRASASGNQAENVAGHDGTENDKH